MDRLIDAETPTNNHEELARLLQGVTCKPRWEFQLVPMAGNPHAKVLFILTKDIPNSREAVTYCLQCGGPVGTMNLLHRFPVPEAVYTAEVWLRWIFDCCVKAEQHELMEWFQHLGKRVFPPMHGPGEDAFIIHDIRTPEQANMDQRGKPEVPSATNEQIRRANFLGLPDDQR